MVFSGKSLFTKLSARQICMFDKVYYFLDTDILCAFSTLMTLSTDLSLYLIVLFYKFRLIYVIINSFSLLCPSRLFSALLTLNCLHFFKYLNN